MKTALKIIMWVVLIALVLFTVLYVSALIAGFGSHPIEAPKAMIEYILNGTGTSVPTGASSSAGSSISNSVSTS